MTRDRWMRCSSLLTTRVVKSRIITPRTSTHTLPKVLIVCMCRCKVVLSLSWLLRLNECEGNAIGSVCFMPVALLSDDPDPDLDYIIY